MACYCAESKSASLAQRRRPSCRMRCTSDAAHKIDQSYGADEKPSTFDFVATLVNSTPFSAFSICSIL